MPRKPAYTRTTAVQLLYPYPNYRPVLHKLGYASLVAARDDPG